MQRRRVRVKKAPQPSIFTVLPKDINQLILMNLDYYSLEKHPLYLQQFKNDPRFQKSYLENMIRPDKAKMFTLFTTLNHIPSEISGNLNVYNDQGEQILADRYFKEFIRSINGEKLYHGDLLTLIGDYDSGSYIYDLWENAFINIDMQIIPKKYQLLNPYPINYFNINSPFTIYINIKDIPNLKDVTISKTQIQVGLQTIGDLQYFLCNDIYHTDNKLELTTKDLRDIWLYNLGKTFLIPVDSYQKDSYPNRVCLTIDFSHLEYPPNIIRKLGKSFEPIRQQLYDHLRIDDDEITTWYATKSGQYQILFDDRFVKNYEDAEYAINQMETINDVKPSQYIQSTRSSKDEFD